MIAGVVASWVVPAIIFVVVIVACLLGLRWLRAEHLDELRSVPLFSGLSDHELLWVLQTAHAESFAPGATIIREGDIGGDFFMLTEGTVKVTVDGTEVATLGAGSYFGEIALIDGGARTATITTTTAVSSLRLAPTAFLSTVDREPMLARAIYAELSKRLNTGGDQIDGDVSRVDRARLIEVCKQLRAGSAHPEWSPATSPVKHRLMLTSLFARGS
jgi:signal-transduction protein with cAMP-binding, CBS, and nucleotidyltransferase domain